MLASTPPLRQLPPLHHSPKYSFCQLTWSSSQVVAMAFSHGMLYMENSAIRTVCAGREGGKGGRKEHRCSQSAYMHTWERGGLPGATKLSCTDTVVLLRASTARPSYTETYAPRLVLSGYRQSVVFRGGNTFTDYCRMIQSPMSDDSNVATSRTFATFPASSNHFPMGQPIKLTSVGAPRMRQVYLDAAIAPFEPISPPLSRALCSAIYLLDLGVGTTVEHEPLGHGARSGVGGRLGAGVCLVVGPVALHTVHITIERIVLVYCARGISTGFLRADGGPSTREALNAE